MKKAKSKKKVLRFEDVCQDTIDKKADAKREIQKQQGAEGKELWYSR